MDFFSKFLIKQGNKVIHGIFKHEKQFQTFVQIRNATLIEKDGNAKSIEYVK